MENLVTDLTDATFDSFIEKQDKIVIVDFWAPWCGPCRQQGPIIDDLAQEYNGQLVFAKVNADENEALDIKFGVSAIPCLMFFKNGKLQDKLIGLSSPQEIINTAKKL